MAGDELLNVAEQCFGIAAPECVIAIGIFDELGIWNPYRQIAAEVGIESDEFDGALSEHGEDEQRAVFAEYHEAVELGIHAVPAVVVDGRYLVQGAVDVDDYAHVVERARAEE